MRIKINAKIFLVLLSLAIFLTGGWLSPEDAKAFNRGKKAGNVFLSSCQKNKAIFRLEVEYTNQHNSGQPGPRPLPRNKRYQLHGVGKLYGPPNNKLGSVNFDPFKGGKLGPGSTFYIKKNRRKPSDRKSKSYLSYLPIKGCARELIFSAGRPNVPLRTVFCKGSPVETITKADLIVKNDGYTRLTCYFKNVRTQKFSRSRSMDVKAYRPPSRWDRPAPTLAPPPVITAANACRLKEKGRVKIKVQYNNYRPKKYKRVESYKLYGEGKWLKRMAGGKQAESTIDPWKIRSKGSVIRFKSERVQRPKRIRNFTINKSNGCITSLFFTGEVFEVPKRKVECRANQGETISRVEIQVENLGKMNLTCWIYNLVDKTKRVVAKNQPRIREHDGP